MGRKQTFLDILVHRLAKLPGEAKIAVALDPQGILDVPDPLLDAGNRDWHVFIYEKNDLALRHYMASLPEGDKRLLIVAVGQKPTGSNGFVVDLSYIPDLIDDATDIIDCSPSGLLSSLVKEPLPPVLFEEPLLSLWSHDIDGLITNYSKYRKFSGKDTVLNRFDAMALALITSSRTLSLEDLANLPSEPVHRLEFYIRVIAESDLNDTGLAVLRNIVLGPDPDQYIQAWCRVERPSLLRFLYFGLTVMRYAVPNGLEELERLGILEFDLRQLGAMPVKVISRIKRDLELQKAIVTETEVYAGLSQDIDKLTKAFKLGSFEDGLKAFAEEQYPAVAYSVGKSILRWLLSSEEGRTALAQWPERDVLSKDIYPKTQFTLNARRLRSLVDRLCWLGTIVSQAPDPSGTLLGLMNVYRQKNIHLSELLFAEATETIRLLKDGEITGIVRSHLDALYQRIETVISKYDAALAGRIGSDFTEYCRFHRLNTQILRNLIQAGSPRKERVWIVILDGMRLDTWDRFIWPRLKEFFDIDGEEQLYLATLPSYTDTSRVSCLAGKLPPFWKDYQNNYTSDHNILLSRHLDLGREESKKKLKILGRAEEKTEQGELDFETAQYRCMIFNISDDWIHHEPGNLVRVNEIIKEKFEKMVLSELIYVDPKDIVVITSDHGFIELKKEYVHKVTGTRAGQNIDDENIKYRYIENERYDTGIAITYDKKKYWTLAIGFTWFERSKQSGKRPRYSHGGISMAEMVIPAVRLRKMAEKKVEVVLTIEPLSEYSPGDIVILPIFVRNQGTIDTKVNLTCRQAGRLLAEENLVLPGGTSFKWDVSITADPKANQVNISAQYTLTGKDKKTEKRQVLIPIKELGSKVEIDTSALDVFDNI